VVAETVEAGEGARAEAGGVEAHLLAILVGSRETAAAASEAATAAAAAAAVSEAAEVAAQAEAAAAVGQSLGRQEGTWERVVASWSNPKVMPMVEAGEGARAEAGGGEAQRLARLVGSSARAAAASEAATAAAAAAAASEAAEAAA
jgi:hypothetical protein